MNISYIQNTFLQKRIDAIVHCQNEILSYICDNLIAHTTLILSQKYDVFLRKKTRIPHSLTAKDMEAKRQSVLISSLCAYSVYLNKVPIQEVEKMIEIHNKIISSNKFWNLVKTDAIPIKTAFFTLLTSLIDANIISQNVKKKAVTSIINSLDEINPTLSLAVWKSMHTAINKIKVNDIFTFVIIIYINIGNL